ncbi:MAG: hypothetical protein ACI865_000715 [Flavobacteriaceae bacterium]|jgi:hypothetical protein
MSKFRFLAILFVLIQHSGNAFAQNEDVLENFTATNFNGNILLDWSITQGNTCNGIEILHSLDSINFTEIGDIEGICGSSAEIIYYDFTHSYVADNVTHFYRLQLGGLGFSWIIALEVSHFGVNHYRLGPNPLGKKSKLQVVNDNQLTLTMSISDLHGKIVGTSKTSENFFILSKEDYKIGKYLFVITKAGTAEKIKGEFIVE